MSHKKRVSNSGSIKKGEHRSPKTEFKKGHKISIKTRLRMSEAHKGKKPYEMTDEIRKKLSVIHKGRKISKEIREKMSIARKGKPFSGIPSNWRGKKHSEEAKRKMSEWRINNPSFKFKDTSIELKIEAELQKQKINYQKQVPLCKIAIVDFYLPEYRIVIECDGDYWHSREKTKIKDIEKTRVLTFNGFNVYRFWGHEINESAEKCIKSLNIFN